MAEEQKKPFNPKEHMMQLKGKDYLQVMWRLVWYRNENPDGQIATELVAHKPGEYAVVKATISEPRTEHVVATAYGSESMKDFHDYLEKAETKAIGRALAILGYGTQFAPELDEEERIVDSPVDKKTEQKQTKAKPAEAQAKRPENVEALAAEAAQQLGVSDRDVVIENFAKLSDSVKQQILDRLGLKKIEDIHKQADVDKVLDYYKKLVERRANNRGAYGAAS